MLDETELHKILADWSFWDALPEEHIIRDIALPERLSADLVFMIQGVRRCGKSTLLTQLPGHYKLSYQDCVYCNFEDPRLLDVLSFEVLSDIVSLFRKVRGNKKPLYFFLDEIQNVAGWEKWLHSELERPKNNHFIITGSNSCLLSGRFGSALTGRHISLELFPFSFSEFQRLMPEHSLESYLALGGFPRALTFEKPQQLLQEYFRDIILRDVQQHVRARSAESIQQVVKMTFESCGSELSFRRVASVSGISVDTVKIYLRACEEAYLLFSCPFFAFSEKKQLARPKKYYPIDPGLRLAVSTSGGSDLGKNLELLVYRALRRQHGQVFYWQQPGAGEVDFITKDGTEIQPYQVTLNHSEVRHLRALDAFYETFPQASDAIFITKNNASDYL